MKKLSTSLPKSKDNGTVDSFKKEKKYTLLVDEFSWKHFWLEVTEVAIAILLAELISYLVRHYG